MNQKFQNKYRISSVRLKNWDYGWNASYFITICTQGREHYFGEVINGKMHLSEIGKIVESEWLKTFVIRPDLNLQMDEFVVMPNHFHAIIIIGENKSNTKQDKQHTAPRRDAMHCVSNDVTIPTPPKNKFGAQSKNLASIIRGFKIGVTKNAREINPGFAWQSRFYDHIIRNEKSFKNIKNYIANNPANWKEDRLCNN